MRDFQISAPWLKLTGQGESLEGGFRVYGLGFWVLGFEGMMVKASSSKSRESLG